jgi:lipoyl(octanoyl) transferase
MTNNENNKINHSIKMRNFGIAEYEAIWLKMKEFTKSRTIKTKDEIWLTEHHPIYTLGINGDRKHINNPRKIRTLKVDRGGQITYHGPGQLMFYVLLDIKRLNINVSKLITILEESIINLLTKYNIKSKRKKGAPGIYVTDKKIASIGLKITNGLSYHGLSFNYDLDLFPFTGINTCGFEDLEVTSLEKLRVKEDKNIVQERILNYLQQNLTTSTLDLPSR